MHVMAWGVLVISSNFCEVSSYYKYWFWYQCVPTRNTKIIFTVTCIMRGYICRDVHMYMLYQRGTILLKKCDCLSNNYHVPAPSHHQRR